MFLVSSGFRLQVPKLLNMKFDNLNRWLSLFANLGVLVGIIFLVLEIGQANRIAERDARIESVTQAYELQKSFLENPELSALMTKLSTTDSTLTPTEQYQARSYAALLFRTAAGLNLNLEGGFITDEVLQRHIFDIRSNIRRTPGVIPYLEREIAEFESNLQFEGPVFDALREEIERHK